MAMTSSVRALVTKSCFALGSIWTAAGVLKLIFGVRITFPLFPPIDLERVASGPAITTGLILVFLSAWFERLDAAAVARDTHSLAAHDRSSMLGQPVPEEQLHVRQRTSAPIGRKPPA